MKKFSQLLLLACGLSLLGSCGGSGSGNTGGGGVVATKFSVSGPADGGAGLAFPFTMTARDATNALAASYSGTVHFTSSDPAATLPHDSTLVNGTGTFSATLTNAGFQTITATDTVSPSLTGSLSVTTLADERGYATFIDKNTMRTTGQSPVRDVLCGAGQAAGLSGPSARFYRAIPTAPN